MEAHLDTTKNKIGKYLPGTQIKVKKYIQSKMDKEIFYFLGAWNFKSEIFVKEKELIRKANTLGIPIITATQMLDSMASNPRPTRAEVSDVANAILDGTDAVMLSNETAVGDYPVEAVETMATIARRIERDYPLKAIESHLPSTIPNAISAAVSNIARQLDAGAIIPLTKSGSTARNVSKFRPPTPILATTTERSVARRLQLVWGVTPLLVKMMIEQQKHSVLQCK